MKLKILRSGSRHCFKRSWHSITFVPVGDRNSSWSTLIRLQWHHDSLRRRHAVCACDRFRSFLFYLSRACFFSVCFSVQPSTTDVIAFKARADPYRLQIGVSTSIENRQNMKLAFQSTFHFCSFSCSSLFWDSHAPDRFLRQSNNDIIRRWSGSVARCTLQPQEYFVKASLALRRLA